MAKKSAKSKPTGTEQMPQQTALNMLTEFLAGTDVDITKCDSAQHGILVAFLKTDIVTQACDIAGVSRTTFYRWENTVPDFAKAAAFCRSFGQRFRADMWEVHMEKRIREGSDQLIKFALQTRGQDRGYVTRAEDSMAQLGEKLMQKLEGLSDDELRGIIKFDTSRAD